MVEDNIKIRISDIPPQYLSPHFNGRIFRATYIYIYNMYGGQVFKDICESLKMPMEFLIADSTWVSKEFSEDFMSLLKQTVGDPLIFEKIGRRFSSSEVLNSIEHGLLKLVYFPLLFMRLIPLQYPRFNRLLDVKVLKCRPGFVALSTRPIGGELLN